MSRRFAGGRLGDRHPQRGKLEEIGDLLAPFGVEVVSAPRRSGFPEPAETESTFDGNARIKAHAAAKASGWPALADDSGLEVDALGGAPGVYTADWAETGQGRDFAHGDDAAVAGAGGRGRAGAADVRASAARWCLAWPDGHDEVFDGSVAGAVRLADARAEGHRVRSDVPARWLGRRPSGRWTAGAEERHVAPGAGLHQARRTRCSWLRTGSGRALGSTCTGPFARPNAPTATSTAMWRRRSTSPAGSAPIWAEIERVGRGDRGAGAVHRLLRRRDADP